MLFMNHTCVWNCVGLDKKLPVFIHVSAWGDGRMCEYVATPPTLAPRRRKRRKRPGPRLQQRGAQRRGGGQGRPPRVGLRV
jgi:hypothetical protein